MKILAVCMLAMNAVTATAVHAQETPERPTASLRLISSPSDIHRWFGVGDVSSRASLCVMSNTGRFHLSVEQTIDLGATVPGDVELIMTTTAGDRETVSWDGRSLIVFAGRVTNEACGPTGNVQVEARMKQKNLTAAVAGNYSTRIRYSVDPA